MSRILLVFTLICLTFGLSGCNDETKPTDKAGLDDIFSTMITDQKEMFSQNEKLSLEVVGDVEIKEEGDHFNVILPKMIYRGEKQGEFHLDPIHVVAKPTGEKDNWEMDITLPKTMPIMNDQNLEVSVITIGDQKMNGIWNTTLDTFSTLNADFKDVNILNKKGNIGATIGSIHMITKLEETSKGLWSGPSKFEVNNLKIGDDVNFSQIKKITSAVQIKDYDAKKSEELKQKIKADPENSVATILSSLGSNFTIAMQMDDFKVDTKERKKDGKTIPAKNFSLEKAHMQISMKDATAETINQKITLGYDNLQSDLLDTLIPRSTNIGIVFQNFPLKKFNEIGQEIENSELDPKAKKAAAMHQIMNLPQILSDAKSSIIIEDTEFKSSLYNVTIDADVKPNTVSKYKSVGTVNIAIRGLERTLKEINNRKATATPGQAKTYDQLLPLFSLVQVIGDKQGDKYVLNFKATEDGQVLLNDKDMSALMAMTGGSH